MVATTIAAVRGHRHESGGIVAGWHLAGLTLGATAIGLVVAAVGAAVSMPRPTAEFVLGTFAFLLGSAAAFGRAVPVPSSPAQVPKAWTVTMEPAQYAFAYGLGLGFGVATRIPSWSLHVLLALVFVLGDPAFALIAASVYAVFRAMPVVAASMTHRSTEEIVAGLDRVRAAALRADGIVTAAIGVALVALGA